MIKTVHLDNGVSKHVHLGGWKKQFNDARDEEYRIKLHGSLFGIPTAVDLRSGCSPIEDQGNLGSCTANMFAGLVEYNEIKRVNPVSLAAAASPVITISNVAQASNGNVTFTTTVAPVPPIPTPAPTPSPAKLVRASRLFEYYATRKIEGTVSEDSGATIRDAIKAGATYGVADEAAWTYDISKFTVNPPTAIWNTAATHKVTSYHSISDGDLQTMKSTLAAGFPIGFGFSVYDYMLSADMAKKGFLPLPTAGEQLQGGHAVCLVGYDDSKQAFIVRNSWGTGWGLGGYFYMAYVYVASTNLASDFWVVQSAPL